MTVLREIRSFQRPGEAMRRWFDCESADLIVWTDGDEVCKIFEFVLYTLRGQ